MKHTLTFPDGTAVSSGAAGDAIRSVKLTGTVNPQTELCPGGVCAAELEVTLFADALTVKAGDVLQLWDEIGLVGTFLCEQPTRPAPGQLRLLAYDYVTRLDVPAGEMLEKLTFPITLGALAAEICTYCGLAYTGAPENPDYSISAFQARGITCRQLMQWICQAGCRFCRALPDGTLKLDWYRQSGVTIGAAGQDFYYQGGMTCSDYTVAPVERVQIAQSAADVGVSYPETGGNTLTILGNALLTADAASVAQTLQTVLTDLTYTPCTLDTSTALTPGDIFTVSTPKGSFTALAMTVERSGGRFRVSCTGSPDRSTSTAVTGSYRATDGRVLNLELGLAGVKSQMAALTDNETKVSELRQDVDHITARVSVLQTGADAMGKTLDDLSASAEQEFAQLQLRTDGLALSVGTMQQQVAGKADAAQLQTMAEHFVFDADGLTISDSATGMAVRISQQQVAFSGGTDDGTAITPNGMTTTDLQVGRRLDVGSFSLIPRTGGNLSLRWTMDN